MVDGRVYVTRTRRFECGRVIFFLVSYRRPGPEKIFYRAGCGQMTRKIGGNAPLVRYNLLLSFFPFELCLEPRDPFNFVNTAGFPSAIIRSIAGYHQELIQ